jgi:hypothetical protein
MQGKKLLAGGHDRDPPLVGAHGQVSVACKNICQTLDRSIARKLS